jgi:NAD(P)-dependent dehydrogenase (short-subunit alcohol dehydrogenase family)
MVTLTPQRLLSLTGNLLRSLSYHSIRSKQHGMRPLRSMENPAANVPVDGIQSPLVDLSVPINTSNIKGLTIIITGGASGIGAAFARHWALNGANIIVGDLNHTLGQSLIAHLRTSTANPHHHFLGLNVKSWTSQLAFFEQAVRLSPHGGIDCVVANAGVSLAEESFAFEQPPDYHALIAQGRSPSPPAPKLAILDVNLTGVLYTTNLAHAYLPLNPGSAKCSLTSTPQSSSTTATPNHRDRHLLLLGSLAGLQPLPTQSLYGISKHAVTGLFRNLRITSPIKQGIRVNMLCPYFTATPILGVTGNALLAGGAPSEIDSVVEAATRFVADRGIVGRGLAVGPRATREDVEGAGLGLGLDSEDQKADMDGAESGGVWEVHAHDFEQSDVFARRVLGITNLVAGRKGWVGLLRDLGWAVLGEPVSRLWAR